MDFNKKIIDVKIESVFNQWLSLSLFDATPLQLSLFFNIKHENTYNIYKFLD
jgi:hypothetical protein